MIPLDIFSRLDSKIQNAILAAVNDKGSVAAPLATVVAAPVATAVPAPLAKTFTPEVLGGMSNQQLRDIYHPLIGKDTGRKNSGKVHSKTLLIEAIMELQSATTTLVTEAPAKKEPVNKGRPTLHGDFAKKILQDHKTEADAFKLELKASNPEKKGAHLIFVANYKKANVEEFAAFEAAWKIAHPKHETASVSDASEVSGADGSVSEKKKRVISEEQKAKMKAGREKAAAAKKALKDINDTVSEMADALSVEVPTVTAPILVRPSSPKMKPE